MEELCTKTVKVYKYGDYRIEITPEDDGLNEVWLYHKDYGIKSLMFGVFEEGDRLIEIIGANIVNYIFAYKEEFEDA